jgi:NAD-dependent DNA ligase
MSDLKKIELEKQLHTYDEHFFHQQPLISDAMYDQLVEEYETLYGSYVPMSTGGVIHNKCKLPSFSPSLDKIKTQYDFNKWVEKYTGPYVVMDKVDGMSIIINYTDNDIFIYTHCTDGIHGSDVSHLCKYLNIPKDIINLEIRGELAIYKDVFSKYNEEYECERAMISGVVNATKNINYELVKQFTFFAFEIKNVPLKTSEQLAQLKQYGFTVPNYIIVNKLSFIDLSKELEEKISYLEENQFLPTKINIPRDGKVIANDLFEQLPTNRNPLHKIAFKIVGDTEEVTVLGVEWNASKHGKLKPRIHFKPIQLEGGTLNWVTGYNAKFIVDNQIGANSILLLSRDIVADVVSIVKGTKASLPTQPYTWNDTKVDFLVQVNDQVKIKRIYTFFDTLETKHVGLKTVEKIYNAGYKSVLDFYQLTLEQLCAIKGFQTKGATKILDSINNSYNNVTLAKVMTGSCIFPNFGEKRHQDILNNLPSITQCILFDKPMVSTDDVKNVHGIDSMATEYVQNIKTFKIFINILPKIKAKLIDNYNNEEKQLLPIIDTTTVLIENKEEIVEYLTPPLIPPTDKGSPLRGMTIVFSGDKKQTNECKKLGAIVDMSVTKRTTLLVVEKVGTMNSKERECMEKNIKIMQLDEFKAKYLQ